MRVRGRARDRPPAGAVERAGQLVTDRLLGDPGGGEEGVEVEPGPRRRTPRACRPAPRWRCCRWRPGRTGSRRARRSRSRAGSTPAWIAARALAWPVPRVSWKCTPTGMPGQARRTASSSWTTRSGVVVPMVSPRQSWSAPAVTAARATSTVRATGVRPSNGQSQAVAMMTSSEPPASWASRAISPTAPTASAVDRPALARLCPSERRHHVLEVRHPGVDRPHRAARVGDQRRPEHPGPADELGGHLIGVGERGHRLRRDERRRLDPPDPGGDEGLQHLQLRLERDGILQLQTVAHADLADVDRRRQHQVELVHAFLLVPRPRLDSHPALRRRPPMGRPGAVP